MIILSSNENYCCPASAAVVTNNCVCESSGANNKFYKFVSESNWICVPFATCALANNSSHLQPDGNNSECTCN